MYNFFLMDCALGAMAKNTSPSYDAEDVLLCVISEFYSCMCLDL